MATAHPKLNMISSEHIEGATIHDSSGKEIGRIDRLMIDKISGQVRYAVVDFCGFMCLRHGNHAVPWSALAYNQERDHYTTNVTEKLLEAAPEFTEDSWMDRNWETQLHQHYKAPPYWAERAASESAAARAM
jgi:sporulation protein YlmC with PRC-barrel domain